MVSFDDRSVLLEFFWATNGPSWRTNNGWDIGTTSISAWYGVTVDEDGRVVELKLPLNRLIGDIPESLGQLSNLRYLDLSVNKLSGIIPASLGQLSNLTRLNLSDNLLSGAIPESLGQLSSLTLLDLRYNNLSGAIPESLGQLSNLSVLNLSNSQLSGAIPGSIGQLSNLAELDLNNNQLGHISEEAARGLQGLRMLTVNLGNNPWTNPPANVVDGGLECILSYWEAIARSGAIESWKLKVVLVGAVKAGKTSLVKGMIHGQPHLCDNDDRTKGVDVHVGEPCKPDSKEELEFIFWDFAGHSQYYSTHQLFLSKGALNLLVVDLKRFSDEPPIRAELVDVWLDALQCRVPGSNVLVVATQTDRLTGDPEAKMGDLRRRVESHLSAQRNDLERAMRSGSASPDIQQGLIIHGVEAVSSACVERLLDLRLKLCALVYNKRDKFPNVGRRLPVSWVRVSAMLDAKRSGKDPILQVSRVGTVDQNQGNHEPITSGVKFLHRTDAVKEWSGVVRTLKLEKEVGSTERNSEIDVFEDAVDQLVREGMILDSDEILYLEPTWINELLRAILDHELDDVTKEDFWKDELEKYSGRNTEIYFDLKKIHDNFPSTGILIVGYLRFLWRNVPEINDDSFFGSLLNTMSRFGVIFQGDPSDTDRLRAQNTLNDSIELFVPLHLPSNILESDLEVFATLLKHQFRKELVYEIRQPYVPPGVLGLLMARFLHWEGVEFRTCWSRGAAFTLGEVLILLYLDTPSPGKKEARITVNLFGERFVSELATAVKRVEHEIKSMFFERFRGLFFGRKVGFPRDVDGFNAIDGMNSVVERIDGLEAHLDRELSFILQGLRQLENNLQDVARNVHTTLTRLNKLHSENMPCPTLLAVRPAAAMVSGKQKRSLWALVKDLGRRATNLACKDMRLCFLCPYDFSEVPCGLDGNGYPFTVTREWVETMRPALKVTAVLAKVAIKAASGLDLPLSDFLVGAKSYLGEELADRVLDDGVIEQALGGRTVPERRGEVRALVGDAYEELKKFMKDHKCENAERCVHFEDLMQLVDDGDSGKVWVSTKNVQLWENARPFPVRRQRWKRLGSAFRKLLR